MPMIKPAIFDFAIRKENNTIHVTRSFHAPLDTVWAAWTEADKLCKWWAPAPYVCIISGLDLRAGGRWSYCMQGPEGDRHYCFFDYDRVEPKTFFSGYDGFCDEQGRTLEMIPPTRWENAFTEHAGTTTVRIVLTYQSAEALQQILEMGFKEGFSMGLDQLDELLKVAQA
jgi:PhnB protein